MPKRKQRASMRPHTPIQIAAALKARGFFVEPLMTDDRRKDGWDCIRAEKDNILVDCEEDLITVIGEVGLQEVEAIGKDIGVKVECFTCEEDW